MSAKNEEEKYYDAAAMITKIRHAGERTMRNNGGVQMRRVVEVSSVLLSALIQPNTGDQVSQLQKQELRVRGTSEMFEAGLNQAVQMRTELLTTMKSVYLYTILYLTLSPGSRQVIVCSTCVIAW